MSIGLAALLDDVAALAKVAAASLDDVAGQAARAGVKSAGVVIDDAAVTPRYVVGFAAEREVPIIWRIAMGSLKNKLLYLLPVALALAFLAPWAVTPLLMLGGGYLCYEGTEKVFEWLFPHEAHGHEAKVAQAAPDAATLEDRKVASAIKTDFILSAEIMAITLAAIDTGGFFTKAIIMAVVGTGITALVYGAVALIVKADDAGVAMAKRDGASAFDRAWRAAGRGLVLGMPYFLQALTILGTAAMIWVGGGIILHGLAVFGLGGPEHSLDAFAGGIAHGLGALEGFVHWLIHATGAGIAGLVIGAALIPLTARVIAPGWAMLRIMLPGRRVPHP